MMLALLLACFVADALSSSIPFIQLEEAWVPVGKPHPNSTVRTTFAIKQTNLEWLKRELYQVSNPKSPRYGRYSNFDKVAKVVHGRPESVSALEEALLSINVRLQSWHYTVGKDFAVVDLPVWGAERLFDTSIRIFQSTLNSEIKTVRSDKLRVPSSLVPHLDFVSGLDLPLSSRTFRKHVVKSRRTDVLGVTPESIDKAYNINGYVSKNKNNSQAIASFLKQYFNPNDLKKFQEDYGIANNPISKTVGDNDPSDPGLEASLDVEYITGVGRNVSTWFVYTDKLANHGQEDFLSWIIQQVNTTDSPWVHSASYGDDASSIPDDFKNRVEAEFQKFGVSGRTVFFASGDSGVNCNFAGEFRPDWPTSSPHVTSVGGTTSLTEVWSDGGGGFSNDFGTPDWQADTVKSYLSSGYAPVKGFNRSGRAYPDVSAFSVDFIIVADGGKIPVDGTSCATPTFAGVVSLLNDVRLSNNKSTLGFLNPLLYQTLKGNGFHDVTEGDNGGGFCKGFKAIKGWDPASGWGGPDFSVLKGLVADL